MKANLGATAPSPLFGDLSPNPIAFGCIQPHGLLFKSLVRMIVDFLTKIRLNLRLLEIEGLEIEGFKIGGFEIDGAIPVQAGLRMTKRFSGTGERFAAAGYEVSAWD